MERSATQFADEIIRLLDEDVRQYVETYPEDAGFEVDLSVGVTIEVEVEEKEDKYYVIIEKKKLTSSKISEPHVSASNILTLREENEGLASDVVEQFALAYVK